MIWLLIILFMNISASSILVVSCSKSTIADNSSHKKFKDTEIEKAVLKASRERKERTKNRNRKKRKGPREVIHELTNDTFEQHQPVVREAKRSAEIRMKKKVPKDRSEYKTFQSEISSSFTD